MTNKVALEIDGKGIIKIELDETAAPITVENFKQLVADGFYDGLIFHRVISGFMIQGGDPTGTGCGGSQNNIKGEFRMNGVNNPISHLRGVISMARSGHPDSASSQFFICHEDAKFLDGQYAAFGKVFEGMDVVDRIANTATNSNDRPLTNQVIKRAYFID
ncbi:MAG: peptidylprolyl isomerase [Eubacteriales bacterium]|nr:peptidylprolyl isomerase [Eubacteriales bacterium]